MTRALPQADFAGEPEELEAELDDAAVEAPESLFDPESLVVLPFDEPVDSDEAEDGSDGAFSEDDPEPARASLR